METVSVALSEIARVGPWALRALGFGYGVAERGAVLLGVAEALGKESIRSLRVDEERITRAAMALDASTRRNIGLDRWEIAAVGKSLIEIGLPAVDFAASLPDRGGWARLGISGVIDPDLLGSILAVATRSGVTAIGVVSAPTAGEASSPRWCACLSSGSDTFLYEGSAGGSDTQLAELSASLGLRLPECSIPSGRAAQESYIDLFVRCQVAAPVTVPDDIVTTNASAALRSANMRGLIIPRVDLEHFYALERRTWAPSSERSRAQAGFQTK